MQRSSAELWHYGRKRKFYLLNELRTTIELYYTKAIDRVFNIDRTKSENLIGIGILIL